MRGRRGCAKSLTSSGRNTPPAFGQQQQHQNRVSTRTQGGGTRTVKEHEHQYTQEGDGGSAAGDHTITRAPPRSRPTGSTITGEKHTHVRRYRRREVALTGGGGGAWPLPGQASIVVMSHVAMAS